MSGPRLFSSPRAYGLDAAGGDLLENCYIEIDDSDYGADRFGADFDKRTGDHLQEKSDTRRRAQAELRRKRFDFTQLIRCWK